MIRNSILYRRWWYVRKRNIKKIRLLLRLTLAAMIIGLVVFLEQNNIFSILGF